MQPCPRECQKIKRELGLHLHDFWAFALDLPPRACGRCLAMVEVLSGRDEDREAPGRRSTMRYLKYAALLAVIVALTGVTAGTANAQVRVGIGIGIGPGYVGAAPVCAYGYYSYYPYACAPYGYYGPSWFVNGVFIGAGPWFHGFHGRPVFAGRPFRPGFVGRGPALVGRGAGVGRGGFARNGVVARRPAGGFHGGAFHGGGRR